MKEKEVGNLGEDIAAQYLTSLGYEIIERNYTVKGGEIDIIATLGEMLVFVEVKARGKNALLSPAFAVDIHKQKKILKTSQFYIAYKRIRDR